MKRPYRVFKRQGMWWMVESECAWPITFATNLEMLWKNAAYLLTPVKLASFRHVE